MSIFLTKVSVFLYVAFCLTMFYNVLCDNNLCIYINFLSNNSLGGINMINEKKVNSCNPDELTGVSGGIGPNFTGKKPEKPKLSFYGICDSYVKRNSEYDNEFAPQLGDCCLNCRYSRIGNTDLQEIFCYLEMGYRNDL